MTTISNLAGAALRLLLASMLFAGLAACAKLPISGNADPAMARAALWSEIDRPAGSAGSPTIVFIHGNGNASSGDWQEVRRQLQSSGLPTLAYDRAGHGRSERWTGEYSIAGEALDLAALLRQHGVDGPVILVAHSYGGAVAQIFAASDDRVAGIVFVDALVPGSLTEAIAAAELARYSPQFAMVREKAPELAKTVIPILQAFPQTSRDLSAVAYPATLPAIVLRAEERYLQDPAGQAEEDAAIARFIGGGPRRTASTVAGTGHQIMKDDPAAVVAAILGMARAQRY
ncbi:alpha/beta fold hydrolase [Paraurantiacibacter namhicola]|nr:alpha/beta fold hydrolase [Paraurantiacibacter namhicola]